MKQYLLIFLLLALVESNVTAQNHDKSKKSELQQKTQLKQIPVKVVVVTMFEVDKDTGDIPGELQYWVERFPLPDTIAFPQGYHSLRYNAEKQVLALCTGMGTARSAASVMALGMDNRFDLSKAYWLVAGISGIDPEDGSAGSAAWAEWLVDGDLAHEIDPREIPADWTTGYLPLKRKKPFEEPFIQTETGYNVSMHLNPSLVNWAYDLTKNIPLQDNTKMQQNRAQYIDYPEAMKPPRVMKGDHLAAMTYWHGKYMNKWANDWVKYNTQGKGNFVTSAMEDTGTGQSLQFLTRAGKADFNRYMVLRTASNFTMQHHNNTAAENLTNPQSGAFLPSVDAAYKVGSVVVNALLDNWSIYQNQVP